MIKQWIVHVEAHWGYRPRFSVRRKNRAGEVTPWGVLVTCPECDGDGHLAVEK